MQASWSFECDCTGSQLPIGFSTTALQLFVGRRVFTQTTQFAETGGVVLEQWAAGCADLVEPPDRRTGWRFAQYLHIGARLLRDLEHCGNKGVQVAFRLRLGGLDHDRLGHRIGK